MSYCAVFVVSGVAEELLLILEGIGMKPWICSPRACMRVCMYASTRTLYSSLCFLLSQVSHFRCKTHRKKQIISRLPSAFSSPWTTTCRFPQYNVLFPPKQRVVFFKTTCRFLQNNVSFSPKQRVVFSKTTCRFIIKFAAFLSCSFGEQNALVSPTRMHPNFIEKTAFPGC